MGQYVKLAWAALILLIILAVGYGISAFYNAAYDSGKASGILEGSEAGYKKGYKAGAENKEQEITKKLSEEKEKAEIALKEKQGKIDTVSLKLEETKKERDLFKHKLDNQVPKVNTVYITRTVEGKYEEQPTPNPVYTADFIRLWNQAIFGDLGMPEGSGESNGYSPGWRGIDGRTPMRVSSQDLLQNHADNMKVCMDTRDTLISLQSALRESGLGVK